MATRRSFEEDRMLNVLSWAVIGIIYAVPVLVGVCTIMAILLTLVKAPGWILRKLRKR